MKTLLAALALLVSTPTLAQTPDAKYGGCLTRHSDTCFSPSVSVTLAALRLKNGDLVSTFDPGVGYGVTFYTSKWYTIGANATLAFPTFEGSKRAQPALTFSFAKYGYLGFACPLYVAGGLKENAMITFAFGSDFNFMR